MVAVRFLENYAPKDGSGREFQTGQVAELSEDGARHFIRRRLAVDTAGKIAPPPEPKAPDTSLPDRAEARHQKRYGGSGPAVLSSTNEIFITGGDM